MKQFCEKHMEKIKMFVQDYRTKYPIPTQCTVEGMYTVVYAVYRAC